METSIQLEIGKLLDFLVREIQIILGDNLSGIYLTGSLSYGDFKEGRSDIDLAVICRNATTPAQNNRIAELHIAVEQKYPKWTKRIECSYIPLAILQNTLPPIIPRPYFGAGIFYEYAPYGNEWLINLFFLRQCGITLTGPSFNTLVPPINVDEVRKACLRDLLEEWVLKQDDLQYLKDSHHQSYVILNLCRILFTLACGNLVSKTAAATWTQAHFPQWKSLVATAEQWCYGVDMNAKEQIGEFIQFVVCQAKEHGFERPA